MQRLFSRASFSNKNLPSADTKPQKGQQLYSFPDQPHFMAVDHGDFQALRGSFATSLASETCAQSSGKKTSSAVRRGVNDADASAGP